MEIRLANNNDLGAIQPLLGLSGLPKGDCHEHLDNFIVTEHEIGIVGNGGLKLLGDSLAAINCSGRRMPTYKCS